MSEGTTAIQVKNELKALANSPKGKILSRFFKTGPGEYGEGDIFLGVKVPDKQRVARKYRSLPLDEVIKLLQSKIHDHRQTALFILVDQFQKAGPGLQKKIYQLYLDNTQHINNWDLVDCSAPKIAGAYLLDKAAERKNKGGTVCGHPKDCRTTAPRRARFNSQSGRLDAKRSWKDQPSRRGKIPEETLPRNAPHDAPLRHRKISGGKAATLPQKIDPHPPSDSDN